MKYEIDPAVLSSTMSRLGGAAWLPFTVAIIAVARQR
jgi:hypothetical protein